MTTHDEQTLSSKEIEPAFGQNMPAPHTLVGIMRERLHGLVLELREARGDVHAPEDVYVPIRRLAALAEGLTDYSSAFRKIAGEVNGFVQDELEEAVGEQDGVPLSGLTVPDVDGTDIKVTLNTPSEYTFDLEAIMRGVAVKLMADNPNDARDPSLDGDQADEELYVLLLKAMGHLLAAGKFEPQVSKVKKLATEIARTDPAVASTITSTIKKRTEFKGVRAKRETPK